MSHVKIMRKTTLERPNIIIVIIITEEVELVQEDPCRPWYNAKRSTKSLSEALIVQLSSRSARVLCYGHIIALSFFPRTALPDPLQEILLARRPVRRAISMYLLARRP